MVVTPRIPILTALTALFVVLPARDAIYLSEVSATKDFTLLSTEIRAHHRDGTVSLGLKTFSPLSSLRLHPSVRILPLNAPPTAKPAFLVIRAHPANSSVIWALALTDFKNTLSVLVDRHLSTYILAPLRTRPGFAAIRVFPRGYVAYVHEFKDLSLRFAPTGHGGFAAFAPARTLAVAVRRRSGLPSLALVDTYTGRLRKISTLAPDSSVVSGAALECVAATYTAVCAVEKLSRGNPDVIPQQPPVLRVHCLPLRSGNPARQRTFQLPNGAVLFKTACDMERFPKPWRWPAVHVMYEYATDFSSRGSGNSSVHRVVLETLSSHTLQPVSWTGNGGTSGRRTVRLPAPSYAAALIQSFRMKYLYKSRRVLVAFRTSMRLSGEVKDGDGEVKEVMSTGSGKLMFPPEQWVFSFGNSRLPTLSKIVPEEDKSVLFPPRMNMLAMSDVDVDAKERKLMFFGLFYRRMGQFETESGPPFVYSIPVPS